MGLRAKRLTSWRSPRMRERHGWWAAPLLLLVVECAPAIRSLPLPIVESRRQTIVPLLDPLIVDVLAVETTVMTPTDPPPGATVVTFHLDSAATVSVLAEGLGRMLAPRLQEESRVALTDPLGQAHAYRRVVVPVLRVGGFTWGQVHAVIAGNDNLIGHDLLSQIPWEVDLNRGLLILDAEPWPSGTEEAQLRVHRIGAGADPERPAWSRNDQVIVRLNGHDVPMTVDTGAALSAVPARVADALKLPRVSGASQAFGVVGSGRMLGEVATAELAFGNLSAGPRSFLILPNDQIRGIAGSGRTSVVSVPHGLGRNALVAPSRRSHRDSGAPDRALAMDTALRAGRLRRSAHRRAGRQCGHRHVGQRALSRSADVVPLDLRGQRGPIRRAWRWWCRSPTRVRPAHPFASARRRIRLGQRVRALRAAGAGRYRSRRPGIGRKRCDCARDWNGAVIAGTARWCGRRYSAGMGRLGTAVVSGLSWCAPGGGGGRRSRLRGAAAARRRPTGRPSETWSSAHFVYHAKPEDDSVDATVVTRWRRTPR